MKTITITIKNFQSRMKAIETRNMKKRGHSLSFGSLSNHFNPCIIEIHDGKLLVINEKMYKELLHKALDDKLE